MSYGTLENKIAIATELTNIVTAAVMLKARIEAPTMRRAVAREVFYKQSAKTEQALAAVIAPVFAAQVKAAAAKVAAGARDIDKVFDPTNWRYEIEKRALPVLARAASEAAASQLLQLGVRLGRKDFNPDQPRDEHGRWGGGGVSAGPDAGGGDLDALDKELVGNSQKLTKFQNEALYVYTTGNIEGVNQILRDRPDALGKGNDKELNDVLDVSNATKLLGAVQNVASAKLPTPLTTYRGLDNDPGITPGSTWRHNGFVSSSLDEGMARSFAGDEPAAMLKIEAITGHYIGSRTNAEYNEYELLQRHGAEYEVLGVNGTRPKVYHLREVASTKSFVKSTATNWLTESGESLPPGIRAELPKWLKREISEQLRESFDQDYWEGMSETTRDDIERVLDAGVQSGESIRDMAAWIKDSLGEEYYHNRALTIARTEAPSALNGGRKAVIEGLQEGLPQLPMRAEWLSVLGNTTRDTHAILDGVPADDDGLWNLAGYMVPWPGHYSLPAGERVSCLCTISISFGMEDDEARELIQEYVDRVDDYEEAAFSLWWLKYYNPDQPRDENGRFAGGGGGYVEVLSDMGGIEQLPEVEALLNSNAVLIPTDEEVDAASEFGIPQPHECYTKSGMFVTNYAYAVELGEHTGGCKLVHGTYDPSNSGLRYGHAWVELPNNRIFDGALQQVFDKSAYLNAMNAKEDTSYESIEAMKRISEEGTFGPWHGGELPSGDVLAALLRSGHLGRKTAVKMVQRHVKASQEEAALLSASYQGVPVPQSELEKLRAGAKEFNPDQPRDQEGQWTDGGGDGGGDTSKYAPFKSGAAAEKELSKSAEQWSDGPADDYFANRDIKAYAGTSDSFLINDCARKNCGDKRLVEKADKLAGVLDRTDFPKDVEVYRSINPKTEEERAALVQQFRSNVGKTFTDNAFVSTTANKKYADKWGDNNPKVPPLKCTVYVPKGSKAAYLPKGVVGRQEWEVLIQRGSKFRVRSASDDEVVVELL